MSPPPARPPRPLLAALALAIAVAATLEPPAAGATTTAETLALVGDPGAFASPPGAGAATAPSTAIVPGSVNRMTLAMSATYRVDVRLTLATNALRGSVTIVARNTSGLGIDRVELNTVMPRLGSMRLGTVTVDGTATRATVDDQTIVVPLGGVLPDGASVTLHVPFSATLRTSTGGSSWLFTRANGIVDLYRWIPWVSRRTPFDRPNHGDPFVTPVSPEVVVKVTTDRPIRLIGTGHRRYRSADGLVQVFEAHDVRDLVLTGATDYRTTSATVNGHTVIVAYRPGAPASAMLSAAKAALARFEQLLGPYPYDLLLVAQSAGGYGMEGPGVAWIPPGVASGNLRYLVTHEIAHQWFYSLVGNDQAREPYADEAAADFVARYVLGLRRASRCATSTLDRTIYRYSATCYYETVYIQGGNLLDDARKRMGSTAFWRALRGYVADHRFGLVHTRALLDALDAGTPLNLRAWWGPRFPSIY